MKKLILCLLLLFPMVMFSAPWEEIEAPPIWGSLFFRTPTPHGWVVLIYSGGPIFIPDENHEWTTPQWEEVKAVIWGGKIFRAPVPHGWLIFDDYAERGSYIPDENHEWEGPQSVNRLLHGKSEKTQ